MDFKIILMIEFFWTHMDLNHILKQLGGGGGY